jgi:hypothetical protein
MNNELLNALRAVAESYDSTGCDGCGVIDESVYLTVSRVLSLFDDQGTLKEPKSIVDRSSSQWVDPFEIVVGEDPGPLNLANDPVDW